MNATISEKYKVVRYLFTDDVKWAVILSPYDKVVDMKATEEAAQTVADVMNQEMTSWN